MSRSVWASCAWLACIACGEPAARSTPAPRSESLAIGWLKGQLHLHSARSADSRTPPADVVRWYRAHGFDFVVFTDHDHVTVERSLSDLLVVPGVELTQNAPACEPPPEPGLSCLLHVNALFVAADRDRVVHVPESDRTRAAMFGAAIDEARALGGIAQINHPNFHYAADAELLGVLAARGALLLEVANEAVDSNNGGDERHPSTEALWDAVLTSGARLYATATDDAHHYDDAAAVDRAGETAFTGDRGFVMVRAERSVAAIRAAIERGDFYASNGVILGNVERRGGTLDVSLPPGAAPHRITFVGSGGRVLGVEHGTRAHRTVSEAYVRAVIADANGRRAWTQPAFAR
jgi:hypothetical protein